MAFFRRGKGWAMTDKIRSKGLNKELEMESVLDKSIFTEWSEKNT